MGLRIHPREERCRKAARDIAEAISLALRENDLTDVEAVQAVNAACSDYIASFAKYAIRYERHGDPNKPGGLV